MGFISQIPQRTSAYRAVKIGLTMYHTHAYKLCMKQFMRGRFINSYEDDAGANF
jgi:hypothetical protein